MACNRNRLLVVDDEEPVRAVLRDAAHEVGYATAGVPNRGEFTEALGWFDPTLVILDLTIPGTDGVELLRDLSDAPHPPGVILVSGQDERLIAGVERLARLQGLHVIGTLTKPVRISALWALLEAARRTSTPEIEAGLEKGEFELFYQPKVDIRIEGERRIVGAEALLRWNHPARGMVGPADFIPVAEEGGAIVAMTEFVIRSAARQAGAWRRSIAADFTVSVNFSPVLMLDLGWPDRIERILREEEVPPAAIMLEVTESAAMADPRKALEIATRLRLKDIALSLDDFGAGWSSATELYRLPLQELKLDRSLMLDVDGDAGARTVVAALVALARELKLEICAEGVETLSAERFLCAIGCHKAQGFLYSRAVSARGFEAYVAAARDAAI